MQKCFSFFFLPKNHANFVWQYYPAYTSRKGLGLGRVLKIYEMQLIPGDILGPPNSSVSPL